MKINKHTFIIIFIIFYKLIFIFFPPKPYEPDETSYLFSGRNIIRGNFVINYETLYAQFRMAEQEGFNIGANPLGYTQLRENEYTITKPFMYPLIVGFFDRYLSYRIINLIFGTILLLFTMFFLRPLTDNWSLFLLILYFNPAVLIAYSRPLMSDFSSMVCLLISFTSFYLILYKANKSLSLYLIFLLSTFAAPLIRIPNLLLFPVLAFFLIYSIWKRGVYEHREIIVLGFLSMALIFLALFCVNRKFYDRNLWTGYHQTQNIRRADNPFAFMKVIAPQRVNLKGILARNTVMHLRDILIAYPAILIFLLIPGHKKDNLYYFFLICFLWIFFIFFQYKVPMNLHFIMILRMYLPMSGFISLLTASNLKNRPAMVYCLIFMGILALFSYLSFLLMTGSIEGPMFNLTPTLWSIV